MKHYVIAATAAVLIPATACAGTVYTPAWGKDPVHRRGESNAALLGLSGIAGASPVSASEYIYCMGEFYETGRGKIVYFSDVSTLSEGEGASEDSRKRQDLTRRFERAVQRDYGDPVNATCHGYDSYDIADGERALTAEHRRQNGYRVIHTDFSWSL